MCFAISLTKNKQLIEKMYRAAFYGFDTYTPVFHQNAFTKPVHPIITDSEADKIKGFQWGLIPFWVKNIEQAEDIRFKTMNARSETIFEKPSFKAASKYRRCIIIADGFFEWRHYNDKKYPYYIYLKEHKLFSFAGLWEKWKNPETGEDVHTFTLITTKANPILAKIHNSKKRMPVILTKENEKIWLDRNSGRDDLINVLKPLSEDNFEYRTISRLISSRKKNSNVPEVLKEYNYKELPVIE